MANNRTKRRLTNSVERQNSRYTQGGATERFDNRLGWWERDKFSKREDDIQWIIRPDQDRRPDKIANEVYQQPNLHWVVLQYNNIVDPETELRPGTQLLLPHPRRLELDILGSPTGGVKPSRRRRRRR